MKRNFTWAVKQDKWSAGPKNTAGGHLSEYQRIGQIKYSHDEEQKEHKIVCYDWSTESSPSGMKYGMYKISYKLMLQNECTK